MYHNYTIEYNIYVDYMYDFNLNVLTFLMNNYQTKKKNITGSASFSEMTGFFFLVCITVDKYYLLLELRRLSINLCYIPWINLP